MSTRWRPSPLATALLALAAASAVAVVATMAWASGGFAGDTSAAGVLTTGVFVLWNVSPTLGLVGAVLLVDRIFPGGRVVLAVGAVVVVAVLAVALVSFVTSDSSTSALLFIFLPLYLWVPLLLTAVVAAAVGHRRARPRPVAGPVE